jgi:hypothetical protein
MSTITDYVATIPTDHTEWTTDYADAIVAQYVASDKGGKTTIRTAWKKVYNDAVRSMLSDESETAVADAKFAMALGDRLVTKKDVDDTDPIVAYRVRFLALSDAMHAVREDYIKSVLATDGNEESHDAVTMRFDNYALSEDDAKSAATMCDKLATVANVNRRSGPNRSIVAHVRFCLDQVAVGTILTSAQIAAVHTDDYPATDSASEGAIGAYWVRATDPETREKSAQSGIRYTVNEKNVRGFQLVTD